MRSLLTLLGLYLVLGCSGSRLSAGDGGERVQARNATQQFGLPARGIPDVVLIVVDDGPGPQGRALRATIAQEFRERYDASRVAAVGSCRLPPDPASPSLVRRYAIVVAASAAGDTGLRAFSENSDLSWLADEHTDADAQRWSEAVAAAIEATETRAPGRYQPLAAAEHWLALLAREVEPETDGERAVLDALPQPLHVEPFLASARDDDSPRPATEYTLAPAANCLPGGTCATEVRRFTPDSTFACCSLVPERFPRFSAQAGVSSISTGCSEACALANFFDLAFYSDCSPRCSDERPISEPSGAVECRVLVAAVGERACEETPGWREPSLRSPALEQLLRGSAGSRICEIVQLEGDALASCVSDLGCDDCVPGFCATRVPELVADCSKVAVPWSLRFPGLPIGSSGVALEAQCNIEP